MGTYRIVGGRPLHGHVPIHGAKNSVLPILAATLVTGGVCELHNCPEISDVDDALELLRCLGCGAERTGTRIRVDASEAAPAELPAALVKRMRAAVLFLGAMLTRFSCAALCHPGGCPLGRRPIDLHLRGLRLMGAECQYDGDALRCTAAALIHTAMRPAPRARSICSWAACPLWNGSYSAMMPANSIKFSPFSRYSMAGR